MVLVFSVFVGFIGNRLDGRQNGRQNERWDGRRKRGMGERRMNERKRKERMGEENGRREWKEVVETDMTRCKVSGYCRFIVKGS